MNLGEQIRQARENAGLTQSELGDAVGRGRSTVYNWERQIADPSPPMLARVRRILDVDENFNPLPTAEPTLSALTDTELVSRLHLIAAEVARRLGAGDVILAPGAEEQLQNTPGAVRVELPEDEVNRRPGTKDRRRRHTQ